MLPLMPDSRGMTVTDLPEAAWPRYELFDGSLHVTPAADLRHQRLVTRLVVRLTERSPHGVEVLAGPNVVADEHNLVIPDVVVTTAEAAARGGLGLAPADLLLVVEVLSPSTRRVDLTLKRDTYSSWGVPYWVVDPEGEDVVRHGPTPSWAERLTGGDIFPAR